MKSAIQLFAAILLIVTGLYLFLTTDHLSKNEIVVIRDLTDSFAALPSPEALAPFYGLKSIHNGVRVKIVPVSDIVYNKVTEVELEPKHWYLVNKITRLKDIKAFEVKIRDALASEHIVHGRNHSNVYRALSRELNGLSESWSPKRYLIAYTDLMEYSDLADFYDPETFEILRTDPKKMAESLEKQFPLKDLKGIEVHIVFEATDYEQGRRFDVVSGFYKSMLEAKGAKVHIGGNLIPQN
jgi:hypothetical protein